MGICGGVGVAHTPTYTGPPFAVDLFQRIQMSLGNGSQTRNREPWPGTPLLSTVIRPL